ncbi:MAG: NAD(P)/FAD-dependent oxidoreductase [Bacteroidales bacterium]|nr:NAD(P)/FAD-dependent oxidoreductase [Bacteroidales bacterium]
MPDNKYDVIIIGAGLGGLECAFMLQKVGMKVLVLEADALIGGCLQTFRRQGHTFDTGFHYVGGLDQGQMLWRLFKYYKLLDLPWRKMDEDCFDEVRLPTGSYPFAQGYEHFRETLTSLFPAQADNLKNYVALLKDVGDNIANSFNPRSADDVYSQSLFARSAHEFLTATISDPTLQDVLSGTSLKMELNAQKLPLYVFAQINSSFIQSAYRIAGGGMQIAESLRQSFESMGGTLLRSKRVTAFEAADGKATAVIVNDGAERYEAQTFISNAHPATTVRLLHTAGLVRKVFQRRIENLENTFGMLTVNVALKPGTLPYQNKNIFAYTENNVWSLHSQPRNGLKAIMISFMPPTDGSPYASGLDILTPMSWDEVSKWFGTKIGCRGEDYVEFKERFADQCLAMAARYVDGLQDAHLAHWVSTPLTYADYTSTEHGSAYGIRKDYNATMFTVLTPKTPVQNVFLTGQNLNLHGILGTSMTSMFTCAEIIGMPKVVSELNA